MLRVNRVVLNGIVLQSATLSAGNSFDARSQTIRGDRAPGTCSEAVIELAAFKDTWTEWGTTAEGDPWRSTRPASASGECFGDSITIYKSKSRFKKRIREMNEDVTGLVGRTPLLDANGHPIGQRMVRETRADGKLTNIVILLITDRMIQGISAPCLKLALTVEKANIICPAESERLLRKSR